MNEISATLPDEPVNGSVVFAANGQVFQRSDADGLRVFMDAASGQLLRRWYGITVQDYHPAALTWVDLLALGPVLPLTDSDDLAWRAKQKTSRKKLEQSPELKEFKDA